MHPSASTESSHRLPRPPSSASRRQPPSRPTSSLSTRPPTSASTVVPRPASSASVRPHSRLTQRPQSRLARANHQRLTGLCEDLVRGIIGNTDQDEFREQVAYATRSLSAEGMTLNKVGIVLGETEVDRMIRGHIQKARIQSRDALADALQASHKLLKVQIEKEHDLDQEIKSVHVPAHLQLLLALASPPTEGTLAHASAYLTSLTETPKEPETLTWKKILEEEPFEGEHWEGVYGLPPGSIKNWREPDSQSDVSSVLSLDSEDLDLDDSSESLPTPPRSPSPLPTVDKPTHHVRVSISHRKEVEDLQSRQYWRTEWKMPIEGTKTRFDIGDASTLGPTLQNVLGRDGLGLPTELTHIQDRYIYEHDAIREILFALQGRNNIMLQWRHGEYRTSVTPRLLHLSLASQASILTTLARPCTAIQHLRDFISHVFQTPGGSKSKTRTLEAFADALDSEIRMWDAWCASKEEAICKATNGVGSDDGLVVSLLSLEMQIRDTFGGSFFVLLDVVRTVFGDDYSAKASPSTVTASLLDHLFVAIQKHLERGERIAAGVVMRVFIRSAEPLWGMVGRWLKDGMGVGDADDLDDEFFIESNGLGSGAFGVGLLDPDYWADGYTLRYEDEEDGSRKGIPTFFRHIAEPVLRSGKAVGLLKALGINTAQDQSVQWKWRPLAALVANETGQDEAQGLFSVSIDILSSLIHDELAPYCFMTGSWLSNAVVEECDLWRHLGTIENLFLMMKGDAMSHFCDGLYAKMDTQQHWNDFHFLNATFNDVVEAGTHVGAKEWVQLSLVRFSYRGSREKVAAKTVRVLDGLLLEYAVPFPLTYIFTPRTLQVYGEIFVFLLQIKRAKNVLERILVRGDDRKVGNELKTFYAIRSRLSWFVNTLLDFVTTYVIHVQILKFHEAIRAAKSMDEMIRLHDEHLDKLQGRCLLQGNTTALHRTIISILDMSLHFSDMFVAFAGDTTTHDISRHSLITKRRRTRGQKRARRDVIGFSQFMEDDSDSSDSDEEFEAFVAPESSFSMSSELDALVRFVRRGAESLAGGTGEAAATFGVIAFTLEDWDI
ncbi:Spc98 family-domain-containing protein [Desarmillaria tabescens]|uniref:Spindle pole body component n=1 Tax=Armillaria tabescens TaxID=1929756 RepID=A0AA39NLD7_ARMTA|nr:Spc98 family-domain-containing protein [Desarmillaria tabescens]KAK0467793.1 Spc98 family-domain-containing protein [Desarmillaria tabescens]